MTDKYRMTRKEIFTVGTKLSEVLAKAEGGDHWFYAPGWSDDKVAAACRVGDSRLSADHVADVRKDLYGQIKSGPPFAGGRMPKLAALEVRLSGLEHVVDDLEERIKTLESAA